jgi:putative intracellular protease/amidase
MSRIAMVVSTVGFHWEEVFAAYWELKRAQCDVDLYSVDGAPARPDLRSLVLSGPGALVGLGILPSIAPTTKRGQELRRALDEIAPLKELDVARVDALYLPGGHGCLFDVNQNELLHDVIRRLYERGCILSGVCHATSTFAFVRSGGRDIVRGHAMTGFPHALDRTLIPLGLVHPSFVPLPLVNDEELRRAGAELSLLDETRAVMDPRWVRVSPFITGVGPKAARGVAQQVKRALVARASLTDEGEVEETRITLQPTG